jgi:hypothetical protein
MNVTATLLLFLSSPRTGGMKKALVDKLNYYGVAIYSPKKLANADIFHSSGMLEPEMFYSLVLELIFQAL